MLEVEKFKYFTLDCEQTVALRFYLFLKNMSDSPFCICGSVEDAQHFFFHGGNYQLHRTVLLDAVYQYQNPSLNLLLYGNKELSPEINITIFERVQAFILQPKRFQPK